MYVRGFVIFALSVSEVENKFHDWNSVNFTKVRSQKKNDIIWEFFPNVGPPHPPLLGTPYQKKILVFILHFRTSGAFLFLKKKIIF